MAQEERFGSRNLVYSAWHRRGSTGRFVGLEMAQLLSMIDVDHVLWLEVDDETKEPVAIIEEAEDRGQFKPCSIVINFAKRANIPAVCVLWTPADQPNPADMNEPDIASFRIQRLWPKTERGWRNLAPAEYAQVLLKMRNIGANQLDTEYFEGIPVF